MANEQNLKPCKPGEMTAGEIAEKKREIVAQLGKAGNDE